jgi:hypothetical protein
MGGCTKSLIGVSAAVLRGVSDSYVLRRSRLAASNIWVRIGRGESTFAVLSFEAVIKYVLSGANWRSVTVIPF